MADPYIDQFETQIYGPFAREQIRTVCFGRIAAMDAMLLYAIAQQKKADAAMKSVIDRQPPNGPLLTTSAARTEASDLMVRFASYLDSLKGRPIDPGVFFQGERPSDLGQRRITKLVAGVKHIVAELPKHRSHLRDYHTWETEFAEAHRALASLEKEHRSRRMEQADLGPEVAAARDAWLAVYGANKQLIRGFLAHLGKPELLPVIFDDLAETHRATGVSVVAGPPPVPAPPALAPPTDGATTNQTKS